MGAKDLVELAREGGRQLSNGPTGKGWSSTCSIIWVLATERHSFLVSQNVMTLQGATLKSQLRAS